ncbi:hypothetical protein O0L34_g5732 [Tuta absoluta]|nr:hypothetical protein O0L34_g5732 [Tuta absoluta]
MHKPVSADVAIDVEAVMARETVGRAGLTRYQLYTVALCALASFISQLITSEYVFTTARIPTRCFIPECEGAEPTEFSPSWIKNALPGTDSGFDNCRRFANKTKNNNSTNYVCPATLFDQNTIVDCEEYVYENTNTAVYTLGLACNEWQRSWLGSARTFGAFLSIGIAGVLSDRWGRRAALVVSCVNTAVIGSLRVFATTYVGFILSVFAESLLGAGAILSCCYVLAVESVPVKYRIYTGITINSFSSVGQLALALYAWMFPNWKHLTLLLYVPQLLTLAFILMPESIRWYISKGKFAEAEAELKKMAKFNGTELSEKTLLELKQAAACGQTATAEKRDYKEPSIILEVFRYKAILFRVVTTPIWWITAIFIYYGLSVNSVGISGNKYINFAIVAFVDLPGFWTSVLLLDRVGRKTVLIAGFWICSICQFAYIFIPKGYYVASLIVYLIGKYTIAMVGTSFYVYTSELYPTPSRQRLFGFTAMMSRIGLIVAPLTPALGTMVWEPLPYVLFGGLALLSGFLIMPLPETRGCRLPDTMQEAADLGKPPRQHKTTGRDNPVCEMEERR